MYDLNDISLPAGVTGEQLERAVTALKPDNGLTGLGECFIQAEENYGINAIVLMAIACLESAYGTSELATEKNNLFGLDARDELKDKPEYGKDFNSLEECIDYAGRRLGWQYIQLDPRASWRYCGSTALKDVGRIYCSNKDWASNVGDLCERIEANIDYTEPQVETEEDVDYKAKYFALVDKLNALIEELQGGEM